MVRAICLERRCDPDCRSNADGPSHRRGVTYEPPTHDTFTRAVGKNGTFSTGLKADYLIHAIVGLSNIDGEGGVS